jgi:hypothetical protein
VKLEGALSSQAIKVKTKVGDALSYSYGTRKGQKTKQITKQNKNKQNKKQSE